MPSEDGAWCGPKVQLERRDMGSGVGMGLGAQGGMGLGCDSVVEFSDLTTVFGIASHTGPFPCLELGATLGKLSTEQTFGRLLIL